MRRSPIERNQVSPTRESPIPPNRRLEMANGDRVDGVRVKMRRCKSTEEAYLKLTSLTAEMQHIVLVERLRVTDSLERRVHVNHCEWGWNVVVSIALKLRSVRSNKLIVLSVRVAASSEEMREKRRVRMKQGRSEECISLRSYL